MKHSFLEILCFLFFLVLIQTRLTAILRERGLAERLQSVQLLSDTFREMKLSDESILDLNILSAETNLEFGELLTILYAGRDGSLTRVPNYWSAEQVIGWKGFLTRYNEVGYRAFCDAYGAVWNDVVCFPVAESGMVFENSWMFERTYGGTRGHEGTDLMPPENVSGYYRILSMTDGVVEQIGWLPKGGYRIGIRSPSGGYFYYAHLDSYSRSFQVGDPVAAGEVLGTMGDTGYGEEGTRGKFAVHLHLGIYIRTEQQEELSVNPYWILRSLRQREKAV